MHVGTESDLHSKLVNITKRWDRVYHRVMLHRVENSIGFGTFDTFVGMRSGAGWLELKIAGPNAKPQMRPGQPGFGNDCRKAGVPAHVLCCSSKGYLRLLNGWTTGPDWRDHLVWSGELSDARHVIEMLLKAVGHRRELPDVDYEHMLRLRSSRKAR